LIDNLTVEENIDLVIDLNKLKRRYETKEILKIV
jgi:ABC-type lipoprotein export system ATPase subunit